MKKIVGTIAAIALAASSAFAAVNVGMGFNRALFVPFAIGTADGDKPTMSTVTSWGGGPRVGVSFSASGEQIGVVGDIKLDNDSVAVNDNAYIWAKPWDWLKIQFGQSFEDTLRGGMCFGTWDWLRIWNLMTGDDLTFTRIANVSNSMGGDESAPLKGVIIALDPIEGLHIGVGLKATQKVGNDNYGVANAEDVFKNIQVQAGYTIPQIVQIKAQWIGKGDHGIINAAVGLKAVEDMTLEVGAFFDTKEKTNKVVSAIWGMPVGPVGLNANLKVTIPGSDASNLNLMAGIGVGYDLGDGFGISGDLRIAQTFAEGAKTAIGFGVFFDKSLGNGSLGIGFEGANAGGSIAGTSATGDFKMAVPIRVQAFF